MERLRDGLRQTDGSWPGLRLETVTPWCPEPVSPTMRSPGQRRPSCHPYRHKRTGTVPSRLLCSLPALLRPRTGPRPTRSLWGPGCARLGSREGFPKTDPRRPREPHLDSSGARVADGALGARRTLQPRERPLAPPGGGAWRCPAHSGVLPPANPVSLRAELSSRSDPGRGHKKTQPVPRPRAQPTAEARTGRALRD